MRYCKAYTLRDLKKFQDWDSKALSSANDLADDTVVYIQDELKVTTNALEMDKEEDFIYTDINDAWKTFCKETLEFEIPDWEKESETVREALAKAEAPA